MVSLDSFETFVERVLLHERGYVNHPHDPGGATNLGITHITLKHAKRLGVVPTATTVLSLTRSQAKDIYKAFYWNPIEGNSLPYAIAFQVFDAAVNHGVERASEWLQRLLGVAIDGDIGPRTIAAAAAVSNLRQLGEDYLDNRQAFYEQLETFRHFSRGWTNRVNGNREYLNEDLR